MWNLDLIREASDALQTHPDAGEAREYLESRGVPLSTAARHHVGVMVPIRVGTAPFLAWAKRYWSSWNGLTFPLFDVLGNLIGLEVRRLPSNVRPGQNAYADFPFTTQNGAPLAFGIHQAIESIWETRRIILVEGVFDYFAVVEAGFPNTVANLTASVAAPMRRFLGRYGSLVIALHDMDTAGRTAACKLIDAGVQEGFLVVVPSYESKDAGTLLQQGQIDVLRALLTRLGAKLRT